MIDSELKDFLEYHFKVLEGDNISEAREDFACTGAKCSECLLKEYCNDSLGSPKLLEELIDSNKVANIIERTCFNYRYAISTFVMNTEGKFTAKDVLSVAPYFPIEKIEEKLNDLSYHGIIGKTEIYYYSNR